MKKPNQKETCIYSAIDVAKYILFRNHELDNCISNLKLQKILYFIQANFLVSLGRPCFKEDIEAWDWGPVIPEVYYKYKVYGGSIIPVVENHSYCLFTGEEKPFADEIIQECMKYSSPTLTKITQNQTPWKNAYMKYKPISNESLKEYFTEP